MPMLTADGKNHQEYWEGPKTPYRSLDPSVRCKSILSDWHMRNCFLHHLFIGWYIDCNQNLDSYHLRPTMQITIPHTPLDWQTGGRCPTSSSPREYGAKLLFSFVNFAVLSWPVHFWNLFSLRLTSKYTVLTCVFWRLFGPRYRGVIRP